MSTQNDISAGGGKLHDGILKVENLTKRFGGLTAVDDLSFHVTEGEILGFIGPNGAGKTTAFNCIMGNLTPTDGTIWYRGEDITNVPTHDLAKRGINRTFQTFAPLADRTVQKNIELATYADAVIDTNVFDSHTNQRAFEVCEQVGLVEDREKTPDQLPHAGLIRLELGRAIATDPDLLMIDEAFAGLSTKEVEEISSILRGLQDEGMTQIIVDHNMRGLLDLIERGIVIMFGSKIADGPPEEIKNDPRVKEAYLGGQEV